MIRILKWLAIAIVLVIVLPPLYYWVMPADPPPSLPPAGTMIEVRPGVSVNVIEQGTGPAVVLVHGLPGSAYDWRETIAALSAAGYRAIAYDRVGYGHSNPRLDDAFNVAANAQELLGVLDGLRLGDATVVGWSYGGVTAIQAATQGHPRLGRIVLVGSGGPSSADDQPPQAPALMKMLYSTPVLRWRALVPPISTALMVVLSEQAFSGQPQPSWWMEGLRANFSRWDTMLTYRGEMFYPIVDDGSFAPQSITMPTAILHGDDDRLAPVATGRYLAEVIPNAQYREVAGGSHMLPVTHAQTLVEVVRTLRGDR